MPIADSSLAPGDYHVEPIIARQRRGGDNPDNLYKGPILSIIHPDTGRLTQLFHPRCQKWAGHFRMEAGQIAGQTDVGHTTVWLLEMNSEIMIRLRTPLIQVGQW